MRRVVGVRPRRLFEELFACGPKAVEGRGLVKALPRLLKALALPRSSIPL